MIHRQTHIALGLISTMGLLLTGCPEEENNTNTNNVKNNANNNNNKEDMSSDMTDVDMTDVDMPEDMKPKDLSCFVVSSLPQSLALGSNESITLNLLCNGKINDSDAEVLKIERAFGGEGDDKVTLNNFICEAQDDIFACSASLNHISSPTGEPLERLGFQEIKANSTLGALSFGVRWHLPTTALKKLNEKAPEVHPLPPGFNQRGVGLAYKTTGQKTIRFGAMYNDNGDHVEVFFGDAKNGAATTHTASINVDIKNLSADGFKVITTPDGADAIWWGYDKTANTFHAVSLSVDKTGALKKERTFGDYQGPKLTAILDASISLQADGDKKHGGVRILALSAPDTMHVLNIFGNLQSDDVVNEGVLNTFNNIPVKNLQAGLFGILDSVGGRKSVETDGVAWAIQKEAADFVLHVVHAKNDISSKSKLTINFVPAMAYTSLIDEKTALILVHGNKGERALFKVDINAGDNDKTLTQLPIPRHVDLVPDTVRAAPKLATGFFTEMPTLGGATDTGGIFVVGKRRRKKTPRKENIIARFRTPHVHKTSPVVVSWDTSDTLTSVYVLTTNSDGGNSMPNKSGTKVQTVKEHEASTLAAENPIFQGAVGASTNILAGKPSPSGIGPHWVSGKNNLSFAVGKYGDILIDGVPLEFDMIGEPITFDLPGSSSNDTKGAMIISQIENAKDPTVTHAAWIVEEDAKGMSEPILIRMPKILDAFPKGGALERGRVKWTHCAVTHSESKISLSMVFTNSDSINPARALISFPLQTIIDGAKTPDKPIDLDFSKNPPVIDKVASPYIIADTPFLSQETMLPPASCHLSANTIELGSVGDGETKVRPLATLTKEQVDLPLLARMSGEKCGALIVSTVAEDMNGATKLDPIYTAKGTMEDCSDSEVLIGTGDFLGDGTTQIFSMNFADFTGKIKRIRIKRKRVGSGFKIEPPTTDNVTVTLEEISFKMPGTLPTDVRNLGFNIEDYNGDGLDDIKINRGLTGVNGGSTATLVFSTGLGGIHPEPWSPLGGPNIVFANFFAVVMGINNTKKQPEAPAIAMLVEEEMN